MYPALPQSPTDALTEVLDDFENIRKKLMTVADTYALISHFTPILGLITIVFSSHKHCMMSSSN